MTNKNIKVNHTELLRKIKDEVLNFTKSPLYEFRVQNNNSPVIGEGSHYAKIMFVGEAPGRNEARMGRPFCGAAGKILDELLLSAGIKREDVYITNIVKDRPPFNRDPLPAELRAYAPFLDRQIEIIQPKIIATLGRFSMQYVMENFGLKNELDANKKMISKLHGKIFKTKLSYGEVSVAVLYHPAVAVYDASKKEELKKDFAILRSHGYPQAY